ncbi:MAG: dihydroorotase [Rickettsiales bacterium]|jgi:dihydroorotase
MPNFSLPFAKKINQSKLILYINARILDPESGFDKEGYLLTRGDKIADFQAGTPNLDSISCDEIIDCQNHLLCPALIDIQVHFRDPGQTHKEDLTSGSKSAVAGGIATVVCQPNTNPVLDSPKILNSLFQKAKKSAYCNIETYAAITKNMEGKEMTDLKKLKEAGAVGFTDDGLPVMNAHLMRLAMEFSAKENVPIAQHAEDLNLSNKGCINEGEVSRKLKVAGIPNISESVIVARDLHILEKTGGHYHLLHISTKEALEEVRRAKKKNLNVTVEICPHHFTLTDEAILKEGTNAKMNPPLRSKEDRDALLEALKDNTIDAITTDHAPHDIDSKNKELSKAAFGIVGVETLLPISLELYHNKLLSLRDLLAKMTYKPADIINIKSGRIKKDSKADLVLIDLNQEWTINKEEFYSKSKNSPFNNRKVKGKVLKTIISGHIVYDCQ